MIVPVERKGASTSYQKMAHPASGFAIVGAAARVLRSNGKAGLVRLGITGLGPKAFRARNVEALLEGKELSESSIRQAVAHVSGGHRSELRPARLGRLPEADVHRVRPAGSHGRPGEIQLKVSGAYTVSAGQEELYRMLQDPDVLAQLYAGL